LKRPVSPPSVFTFYCSGFSHLQGRRPGKRHSSFPHVNPRVKTYLFFLAELLRCILSFFKDAFTPTAPTKKKKLSSCPCVPQPFSPASFSFAFSAPYTAAHFQYGLFPPAGFVSHPLTSLKVACLVPEVPSRCGWIDFGYGWQVPVLSPYSFFSSNGRGEVRPACAFLRAKCSCLFSLPFLWLHVVFCNLS